MEKLQALKAGGKKINMETGFTIHNNRIEPCLKSWHSTMRRTLAAISAKEIVGRAKER